MGEGEQPKTVLSYWAMLTLNVDHHPPMARVHKPGPRVGLHQQDERSVIPIGRGMPICGGAARSVRPGS